METHDIHGRIIRIIEIAYEYVHAFLSALVS